MQRSWIIVGVFLFAALGFVVFPFIIGVPWNLVFSSDAIGYSTGAKNLLLHSFYTFDGVHPFMDREPMMSFFLVPLYALFGIENGLALSLVQGIMLFVAAWCFCNEAARRIGPRAAGICFVLLLTSGSVMHTVFSAYRECLALILLLFFSATFLSSREQPTTPKTIFQGLLLGLVILTYYPFMFFPPLLLVVFWIQRRSLKEAVAVIIICYVVTSAWSLRNFNADGHFRVIDSRRTAVMWYVRGEQAEKVHGFEPFWCLWSEYVSRDWTGRSPACSFNGLMHQRWPQGFTRMNTDYTQVIRDGRAKIRAHLLSYFNFSFYEVIELHLPFLGGGWSFRYNLFAAVTMFLLYVGFFAGIPRIFRREHALFIAIIGYNTLIFILTDATPRYLMPVVFCYALIAGIGYDWLLNHKKRLS